MAVLADPMQDQVGANRGEFRFWVTLDKFRSSLEPVLGLTAGLTHGRCGVGLGLWAGLCIVTGGETCPEAGGGGKMKVGVANLVLGESLVLGTAKGDRMGEFCSGVVGGEETGAESKRDPEDEPVFLKELVKGFEGRGGYTSLSALLVIVGFSICEGQASKKKTNGLLKICSYNFFFLWQILFC